MRRLLMFSMCVAVLFPIASVSAFSAGEQRLIDRETKYFNRTVKSTNRYCGSSLKATIDWKSFQGELKRRVAGEMRYSFKGYCEYVLNTLYRYCGSNLGKQSVRAGFKSFTCKFGGVGKRKLQIQSGQATLWVDWKASNYTDFVEKHLGRALPDPLKQGLTLAQRLKTVREMKYFKRKIKSANYQCGSSIKASIDWKSFKGQLQLSIEGKIRYGYNGYCGEVLDAIYGFCNKPKMKKRVQKKLKRFVCRYGGRGKRRLKLRAGTLIYTVDWKATNNRTYIDKILNRTF